MGEWFDLSHMSTYGKINRGSARTLPALFLPHGSPPIPIERCRSEVVSQPDTSALPSPFVLVKEWLQTAAQGLGVKPKAIVFMSPHYMRPGFCVSSCDAPATLMDFDDDTDPEKLLLLQKLEYPCRGSPEVAQRVSVLLQAAGLPCTTSPHRGMDHGVWTPLYVMYPDADIPVVSISVNANLDAEDHIKAGKALQCLASEGVLILGSGEVVHNVPLMGQRGSQPQPWCTQFENWIKSVMASSPSEDRDAQLARWREKAPGAQIAHPVDQAWPAERGLLQSFSSPGEHLMPWFFAYGVHHQGTGRCVFKEYLGSLPMAAYEFNEIFESQQSKL